MTTTPPNHTNPVTGKTYVGNSSVVYRGRDMATPTTAPVPHTYTYECSAEAVAMFPDRAPRDVLLANILLGTETLQRNPDGPRATEIAWQISSFAADLAMLPAPSR